MVTSSQPINCGNLNITAGSGGVGSLASPLVANAQNLTVNAGVGGYVFISSNSTLMTLTGTNLANNLSVGMNAGALFIAGTAAGTTSVNLAADSLSQINLSLASSISAPTVVLQGASVDNSGSITATSLTVSNPSGDLYVSGIGTWSTPGSVTITSSGSTTVNVAFVSTAITYTAQTGLLTVPNVITASLGAQNGGGSISLTGASIQAADITQPIQLTANGSGIASGQGGSIFVTSQSDLVIGNVGNGFILSAGAPSAQGGDGGSVSVVTTGTITLDTTQIFVGTLSGNGGSITLGANFFQNASAGPITLSANGTAGHFGGSISISTPGLITLGSGNTDFQLSAHGSTSGTAIGGGGAISLIAGGEVDLGDTSGSNLNSINNSVGPLTGQTGSGGHITLNAGSDITWNTIASLPLTLSVNGVGTGDGGSIAITIGGKSPQTIGFGAGQFTLLAAGGPISGSGGGVSFMTGGNLSYNSTITALNSVSSTTKEPALYVMANPKGQFGDGGYITLAAGNGDTSPSPADNLFIKGALIADGKSTTDTPGAGGSITLISNSGNGMEIDFSHLLVSGNGTTGSLSVTGKGSNNGNVTIENQFGNIDNFDKITLVGNLALNANGSIFTLSVGSKTTNSITVAATGGGATFTAGTNTLTANPDTGPIGSGIFVTTNGDIVSGVLSACSVTINSISGQCWHSKHARSKFAGCRFQRVFGAWL